MKFKRDIDITKILKKIRNKTRLFRNRFRGVIRITFEKGLPRLHIHEKYKFVVSWSLRLLTLAGIITSVINFPWYFSLGLSIVLVALEQFFERAIFIFSSLFVHAIPYYKSEDWKGMVWGIPAVIGAPYVVGVWFESVETAKRIFPCLLKWNENDLDDTQLNNICLSAIIEKDGTYSMYIYPGIDRPAMKKFFDKVEEENKGKEHYPLIMQVTFCKSFDLSGSYFDVFRKVYTPGRSFFLKPYTTGQNGQPIDISKELGHVYKKHLKIKNRSDLDRWEDFIEFIHGKHVMEL